MTIGQPVSPPPEASRPGAEDRRDGGAHTDPTAAGSRGAGTALWLAGCGILAAHLACELYFLSGGLGYPLDDSWIHLHFARQLALGEGLSYNPGELSTGSTAPLWTALLALGFALPGSAVGWSKLLGGFFYLATADATARLAAELGLGRGWRRLAAALVLATPWLAWSALSGMEITLFATLSLWAMVLHLRERAGPGAPPVSVLLFALAALARPEGAALLALALVDRAVVTVREGGELRLVRPRLGPLLESLALAAVALAPTLVFYRLAGGSFLPSTFAVKAAPLPDLIPSGSYLRAVVDIYFRSQPLMLLTAGAGVLTLVERLGGPRDRGLLVPLWPLALPLAYSLLAPESGPLPVGNFGRYYFPLLPVVVVLGMIGLEATAERIGGLEWNLGERRLPLRALFLVVLLAPQLWGLAEGTLRYARTVGNVEDTDVRAARWLGERLSPEALLAVQDIGAIKYHLPNRVIDLAGIVTPEIVPVLRGGEGEERYWEERVAVFLAERRPDYLVIFPESFPWLSRAAPGFEQVASFRIEDNLAMIGSELEVLSTPWTDQPLKPLPEEAPR